MAKTRSIGESILYGASLIDGDSRTDQINMANFNKQKNKDQQQKNSKIMTDAEMFLVNSPDSDYTGRIADIKGSDLLRNQEALGPGGLAGYLNSAGMNQILGAGPNMAFSSATMGKTEDGEDALVLNVATIENEKDDKGFFNIRARLNSLTEGGKKEAEGGEPIVIPLKEFNAEYKLYRQDNASGANNEFLLRHFDPGSKTVKSGILNPSALTDKNQIGNIDPDIIKEVREANKRAIAEELALENGRMTQGEDAYNREDRGPVANTPKPREEIMGEIFNEKAQFLINAKGDTTNISKDVLVGDDPDHTGGREIPANLTAKDFYNNISENDRKKITKARRTQSFDTFNKTLGDHIGQRPSATESAKLTGSPEDFVNRAKSAKLFKNHKKDIANAFYKDKGLYDEFNEDPEAFAVKYSDADGKFSNWKEPKPNRKVVKELAEIAGRIDNPAMIKALNSGDTEEIKKAIAAYGVAQEGLSADSQESVVKQIMDQNGQSVYPYKTRAKLMYLMTADMEEDRALAWLGGAGGTYLDTGTWEPTAVAALKSKGRTPEKSLEITNKIVSDFEGFEIQGQDDKKLTISTFFGSAGEDEINSDEWGVATRQLTIFKNRALASNEPRAIEYINDRYKEVLGLYIKGKSEEGIWNSIKALPFMNGAADRNALGEETANIVAVDGNGDAITDIKNIGNADSYRVMDTFGAAPRAGKVSVWKTIADLGDAGGTGPALQNILGVIAVNNARYIEAKRQANNRAE